MDFRCNKNCMLQWICSWCNNFYCDDTCCPYRLKGKPKYLSEKDVAQLYWNILTEKTKK